MQVKGVVSDVRTKRKVYDTGVVNRVSDSDVNREDFLLKTKVKMSDLGTVSNF